MPQSLPKKQHKQTKTKQNKTYYIIGFFGFFFTGSLFCFYPFFKNYLKLKNLIPKNILQIASRLQIQRKKILDTELEMKQNQRSVYVYDPTEWSDSNFDNENMEEISL